MERRCEIVIRPDQTRLGRLLAGVGGFCLLVILLFWLGAAGDAIQPEAAVFVTILPGGLVAFFVYVWRTRLVELRFTAERISERYAHRETVHDPATIVSAACGQRIVQGGKFRRTVRRFELGFADNRTFSVDDAVMQGRFDELIAWARTAWRIDGLLRKTAGENRDGNG